ncbi:cell division protein FtsL [Desulfonema ishimotonii]|uniref:Cell division protein FtsL n=1 Tax=Desulfonema ishimotonii TaxID=45657 RepID=A0A401FYD4_9BACT|nr:cell division protein FtsL [Desulfonema ishimotonii]GBC61978.1 cell division protein FtsL [Desulfonema ishimotonii]
MRRTESRMVTGGYDIRGIVTWVVLMSLFVTQLLVYTWCRVQCVQVGYEISKEADDYQNLMAVQNTLKIELERLKSPDRISKIAHYQLGLVTPVPTQKKTIVVHEND